MIYYEIDSRAIHHQPGRPFAEVKINKGTHADGPCPFVALRLLQLQPLQRIESRGGRIWPAWRLWVGTAHQRVKVSSWSRILILTTEILLQMDDSEFHQKKVNRLELPSSQWRVLPAIRPQLLRGVVGGICHCISIQEMIIWYISPKIASIIKLHFMAWTPILNITITHFAGFDGLSLWCTSSHPLPNLLAQFFLLGWINSSASPADTADSESLPPHPRCLSGLSLLFASDPLPLVVLVHAVLPWWFPKGPFT